MARREDRSKAIELRLKGFSYSQIKQEMGLSKSTLSGWLCDYPLSPERIRELGAANPRRIESFRNTFRKKREDCLKKVFEKSSKKIGTLSRRELFLAGLFLYWGEGSKTSPNTFAVSNTDPAVLSFFMRWLRLFNIPKNKVTVVVHVYKDMNIPKIIQYWRTILKLPLSCFRKPYVKDSNLSGLTYKNGFGHGTCNIRVFSKKLHDEVIMGLKFIREKYLN